MNQVFIDKNITIILPLPKFKVGDYVQLTKLGMTILNTEQITTRIQSINIAADANISDQNKITYHAFHSYTLENNTLNSLYEIINDDIVMELPDLEKVKIL